MSQDQLDVLRQGAFLPRCQAHQSCFERFGHANLGEVADALFHLGCLFLLLQHFAVRSLERTIRLGHYVRNSAGFNLADVRLWYASHLFDLHLCQTEPLECQNVVFCFHGR